MRALAVIGHLSRDTVDGGPPRIGGGPFYAARALRALGRPARIVAKCGERDRATLLPRLAALGLPVTLISSGETAAFSLDYEGEHRRLTVTAVGEPWTPEEVASLRADCVHVAPLLRSDFPEETLAELGRGRRLLLDGQGLVRRSEEGVLALDGELDRAVLRHASILKLAEDEAEILGGIDAVAGLGVAEAVVTLGSRGCVVLAEGRVDPVPAHPIAGAVDPTGAGDGFAAAYLASRCDGHVPTAAARRATAVVAGLLR